MRLYSPGRAAASVFLLLVALTCAAQGAGLRARRSFFEDIGNTINNIGETVKDTVMTGFDYVFKRPADPETTTLEPDAITGDYREIINVPIRCPPNHVLVKNRCRMML